MASIGLIAGLGNPGADYAATRHNAGFWFVDALAAAHGASLRAEAKFHGELGRAAVGGHDVWLLKPTTFMNHSGQAVAAVARYYKLAPEQILVAHDDLDLPVGTARLKRGGGHGGHNGLRDIINHLGSRDFLRLRLGIHHPGDSKAVVDYVLGRPSAADREAIEDAIARALDVMPLVVSGDLERAMNRLHSSQ